MNYPWILFDADDTLFDFKKSANHALKVTLQNFKIKDDPTFYSVYKEINNIVWAAFERNEINAVELRYLRFERFLESIGEYRDPNEMNAYYLNQLSQTEFLIEGARELVEDFLSLGYRLCLITNGLKEVQRPRIKKARFESYFEGIVVSDEIGVSKPDNGFFEYAFKQIGNPNKSEVIVVGDSLSSDIQGGNNFGVDTCWFNPAGKSNLTQHKPTFEIDKIDQLREII